MKRIVIIGNSIAGIKVIEEISQQSTEYQFLIICCGGPQPYDRNLFSDFLGKKINLKNLYCKSEVLNQKDSIQIINDKQVNRINFKRKKIFCDDKQQFDYDILVLTDTPEHKFPNIKGTNKKGIYGLRKLTDVEQIQNELPLCETITLQSDSYKGLELAFALASRGKEVLLITSKKGIGADVLGIDRNAWILDLLDSHGVRFIFENEIEEVLGDGYVKAVKLKSGKILASQMIIFEDVLEDFRILSETELTVENKIQVNQSFETVFENVYALDRTCQAHPEITGDFLSAGYLQEQGRIAAAKILNQEIDANWPQTDCRIQHNGVSLILCGVLDSPTFLEMNDSENKIFKKVLLHNGQIQGYILINAQKEEEKIAKLMRDNVSLTSADQFILESDLDYSQILNKLTENRQNAVDHQPDTPSIESADYIQSESAS